MSIIRCLRSQVVIWDFGGKLLERKTAFLNVVTVPLSTLCLLLAKTQATLHELSTKALIHLLELNSWASALPWRQVYVPIQGKPIKCAQPWEDIQFLFHTGKCFVGGLTLFLVSSLSPNGKLTAGNSSTPTHVICQSWDLDLCHSTYHRNRGMMQAETSWSRVPCFSYIDAPYIVAY